MGRCRTVKNLTVKCYQWFVRLLVVIALVLASIQLSAETKMYFIHNDHLGAPQMVTDDTQSVVWEGNKKPFGEVDETTSTIDQQARFPGQWFDQESGLYYNYYRDYDPSLGRYIQSDPIGINRDYSDPQLQLAIQHGLQLDDGMYGLNHLYGYAEQNPLFFTDPFGLQAVRPPIRRPPRSPNRIRQEHEIYDRLDKPNPNPYDFSDLPPVPKPDPQCYKKCDDDGDQCDSPSSNTSEISLGGGCRLVCFSGPQMRR